MQSGILESSVLKVDGVKGATYFKIVCSCRLCAIYAALCTYARAGTHTHTHFPQSLTKKRASPSEASADLSLFSLVKMLETPPERLRRVLGSGLSLFFR